MKNYEVPRQISSDRQTKQLIEAMELFHDFKHLGFQLYNSKERPCGIEPSLDEKTLNKFDFLKENDWLAGVLAMWDEYRKDSIVDEIVTTHKK